ncbi:MAG: chorismate synthase [Ruminococcaceae bacterium]|nr:chorismate synthase [Oscillospiraceae bacterium]
MSSTLTLGNISLSIFGESHGPAIGAVIDNLPAGEELDIERIYKFMARRAPKKDGTSTMRSETDTPEIISGFYNGKTTGEALCAVIKNKDQHSADYKSISELARPGHADYTAFLRYNGSNDPRGGGHFSGRLTAPLVFAGAVCEQMLEKRGITTAAHIYSIAGENDRPFDPVNVNAEQLKLVKTRYLPVLDKNADEKMRSVIDRARNDLNSVGGIIECCAVGFPAGLGSPIYNGIENRVSQLVFGIPAVKGIEFGIGFEAAAIYGSENNDEFYIENGEIKTRTNNSGGILGGISNGMPIIFRAAIKPTPSIARPQNTVNFVKKENSVMEIKGRHDPCVVPRAVPCVEAALNVALMSFLV